MNTPQEFVDLCAHLSEVDESARALVTIVRTRGSTYRRVGARMLVDADGGVLNGLSGGCPQADIVQRALEVISKRVARRVVYNRENGADLLFEQGCGGEIEILIEVAPTGLALEPLLSAANTVVERREGVFGTLYKLQHEQFGTVQHLCLSDLAEMGLPDDAELCAHVEEFQRGVASSAMFSNGAGELLLERIRPRHRLLVIGDNSGSRAVCKMSAALGWETLLVSGQDLASHYGERPEPVQRIICTPDAVQSQVKLDAFTSAMVMTHSLESDIAWLRALQPENLAYVGVLGSRKRAAQLYTATGLMPEKVFSPAGLDIGSETPESIGLSVIAQIHAVLNGRKGQPLTESHLSIHP